MRFAVRNPRSLVLLSLLALLAGCSQVRSQREGSRTTAKVHTDRKPAPGFTLKDSSGAPVSLADYRGKVVLLNFWATWCGPCQVEIPWFQDFEKQYKSRGFEVVGVSMDEDGWTAVKPYIAEHKLNYRVLLGDDSVSQLYGGLDALPTTFIIDRDGKFAFPPHIGLVSRNVYSGEIENLLGEQGEGNTSSRVLSTPAALFAGSAK